MNIIKRDNTTQEFSKDKLLTFIQRCTDGLANVDPIALLDNTVKLIRNGNTTIDIYNILLKQAIDSIEEHQSNYEYVASRIFLFNLYKTVNNSHTYPHLRDYFKIGIEHNRLMDNFYKLYDLDKMNAYIKPQRDFDFKYISIKTVHDRYLLKDPKGKCIELPQHMFMAIAMFLAHKEENKEELAMHWYDILSTFKAMVATPILSNCRTNRNQLSSCYVTTIPDNIEGIFNTYKEMALYSKYGGGIGVDITSVRSVASSIDNNPNASKGVIPFSKIINDLATAVDQLGCVYRNSYVKVLDYVTLKDKWNNEYRIDFYSNNAKRYEKESNYNEVISKELYKYLPRHRGYTKEEIHTIISEYVFSDNLSTAEIINNILNKNIFINKTKYKVIINKYLSIKKEIPEGFKQLIYPNFSHYAVNESGYVININKLKKLTQVINQKGYFVVSLYDHKVGYDFKYTVHKIVYETFNGLIDRTNDITIDHIDFNKKNNKLSNLQLITRSDNSIKNNNKSEINTLKIRLINHLMYGKRLNGGRRTNDDISIKEIVEKVIPIYEVKRNDLILSFNTELGKSQYQRVLKSHNIKVAKPNQIKLIFDDNNYIITSKWHPMCVYDNYTKTYYYKKSEELEINDLCVSNNGLSKLVSIDLNPNVDKNYKDLTVSVNNNYFCSSSKDPKSFHVIHNTRKGSIAVYLQIWHRDILDFIDLRKNSGDERKRCHDLFPAVWICDLFMDRVNKDLDFSLFDPIDTPNLIESYGKEFDKYYIEYENNPNIKRTTIKAKELWKRILVNYFESGLPFLGFKDTCNYRNPNDHVGTIRSSNLCTEIIQNTKTDRSKVNVVFEDNTRFIYDELDVVQTNYGFIKAKKINSLHSIDGKKVKYANKIDNALIYGETAVCNLASINLSKVNTTREIEYITKHLVRLLDNVIDLNFYPHYKAQLTNTYYRSIGIGIMGEANYLANKHIMFGSDAHIREIDRIMEDISYFTIKASSDLAKEKGSYKYFKGSKWSKGILPIENANKNALELCKRPLNHDWKELSIKVMCDGIRNGYLLAIAPTSSISIVCGTSQTIEPIYKRKWYEENLSGMIPVIANNLNIDNYKYYISAYNVEQEDLIKVASIRQKWLDQGQSLNIFMNIDNVSGKRLSELYMLAWNLGIKTTYYLRTKSPEINDDAIDRSFECEGCQ